MSEVMLVKLLQFTNIHFMHVAFAMSVTPDMLACCRLEHPLNISQHAKAAGLLKWTIGVEVRLRQFMNI